MTFVVVNEILRTFFKKKLKIRPLKLQKILYFICGIHYATQEEWIIDENFFVWPYGPVDVPVYRSFSHFGFRPINTLLYAPKMTLSADIVSTISETIEKYGEYDDLHLSNITHDKGTPWEQVHSKHGLWSEIDRKLINDYFVEALTTA